MSVGRKGDKTYTGHNGVRTDALRAKDKLRSQGSGIDGRYAPPSQEALRKFIAAQVCPWCNAGPFKMLATHVHRAHGISADEFRTLAGLTRHAPLCAESHSAECANRLAGKALPEIAYERAKQRPRTYSEAGRASQREKAALVPQDDRLRAARASGDSQLAQNAAKHAEIVRRFQKGEPLKEIAEAVGVSGPTVQRTLRREGLYVDGRTRRWKIDTHVFPPQVGQP